ncbi:hypothetical protein [Plantactinospora sp. B24E8]|uniref:hypothetical protein n=1 Tax=Plantactinospora sp. B24E8 TaxID=3153567 RepID=UPI00325F5C4C
MWTTTTANRVSLTFELLGCVAALALAADALRDGDETRALTILAIGAILAAILTQRNLARRTGAAPRVASVTDGRAADEYGAYAQLRAWAVTGQVAFALLLVAVTGAALLSADDRADSFLWLFLLVALVYEGSLRWFLHRAR